MTTVWQSVRTGRYNMLCPNTISSDLQYIL